MRKSRKNAYLILFSSFVIWLISFDYSTEKDLNLIFNIFRSLIFTLVYAFFDWAVNGKDYKKKE
ncbi:hypothetical protein M3175_06670 [Robertmurraya korlensis]|uniref:hypothetical protein n=1 Tax=Robertmurraya korlensis TaxID=519977 RepID=UPI002041BA6A|nr:hypothetical protein [Robertmurraya korlensis]MCM3600408.1 hypothetical protein [Robertmurraya korlensis]